MPGAAFVYGTLMADEVVKLLIARVPPSRPATLSGYTRYGIKGQVFPAIVPTQPTSVVKGKVLMELTPKELDILDAYESIEYYRDTVRPVLEDGTEVEADVYIFKDQYRDLLEPSPWDYDVFRSVHLADYLAMTQRWCEEDMAAALEEQQQQQQ